MSQIIASTYEVTSQLGAGGVDCLTRHPQQGEQAALIQTDR